MKLDIYPTRIDCERDDGALMFRIKTYSETAAEIVMPTPMNASQWDQIAPLIRQALVDLRLVEATP